MLTIFCLGLALLSDNLNAAVCLTFDQALERMLHSRTFVSKTDKIVLQKQMRQSKYSQQLAKKMSKQAQEETDELISKLRGGNTNPGIGTRSLGKGFYELRSKNGRVIVKQIENAKDGRPRYDIIAKFQCHTKGDVENSKMIQRLMSDYNDTLKKAKEQAARGKKR